MAGRKIRDAEDARACLSAVASSGLRRAQWARAHGVDGRSLNAWRLNLAERVVGAAPAERALRLVELVPEPVAEEARYVVRCGSLSVEVDHRFDGATLRRLLAVVASC
jgi:hypothetical protein